MDNLVEIDIGTDTRHRYIINPLFEYMVEYQMSVIRETGRMFGLNKEDNNG